jgi:protein-S-isoprenylcysteine O-methyltransferase Ste14
MSATEMHGHTKSQSLLERIAVPLGIDLSAWISGASFALGVFLIGPQNFVEAPLQLVLVIAAYSVFLFTVLMIQRHMRLKTLSTTFGTPQSLTTSGIFRFSRNPIYVAFLLPLASLALFALPAAAIAAAFYVIAMNATVIPKEERDLTRIFGKSFTDYATKTRRWI